MKLNEPARQRLETQQKCARLYSDLFQALPRDALIVLDSHQ